MLHETRWFRLPLLPCKGKIMGDNLWMSLFVSYVQIRKQQHKGPLSFTHPVNQAQHPDCFVDSADLYWKTFLFCLELASGKDAEL